MSVHSALPVKAKGQFAPKAGDDEASMASFADEIRLLECCALLVKIFFEPLEV